MHIEVKKADGAKCDRCWNYSTHVGEDKTYPTVCERCSAVLKELENAASPETRRNPLTNDTLNVLSSRT